MGAIVDQPCTHTSSLFHSLLPHNVGCAHIEAHDVNSAQEVKNLNSRSQEPKGR